MRNLTLSNCYALAYSPVWKSRLNVLRIWTAVLENPHWGKTLLPFINKTTGLSVTKSWSRCLVASGEDWIKSSEKDDIKTGALEAWLLAFLTPNDALGDVNPFPDAKVVARRMAMNDFCMLNVYSEVADSDVWMYLMYHSGVAAGLRLRGASRRRQAGAITVWSSIRGRIQKTSISLYNGYNVTILIGLHHS